MFDSFRRFILFLVGATLPIGGINLGSIGNFWVTPFKLLTAILLGVAMTQYVITARGLPRNAKTPWVILFLASYVLSSAMGLAVNIPLSAIFVRFTTFLSLVLYYFLITYVLRTMRDLRVLLWALLVGGAISVFPAAMGIEQGMEAKGGTRYAGLSGSSNIFGYDLAVCLPIAMALFFSTRRAVAKGLAIAFAAAAVTGILLSLSRSAFVSVAGMWVLWVIRTGRIDSIKYVIPALIGAVAVALLAPEDVINRIQTMTDPEQRAEDYSIQSRLFVYGFALKAFVTHPIVGVGNFGWYVWIMDQPTMGEDVGTIHNAYLEVATFQGLLGLVPFIAYLRLTWRDYNRARRAAYLHRQRRDPLLGEIGHYAMFLQVAFFGNLIGNVFGPTMDSKSAWLMIALSTVMVGLAADRLRTFEAETPAPAPDPLAFDYGARPAGAVRA
jgi:O-antigen ligase